MSYQGCKFLLLPALLSFAAFATSSAGAQSLYVADGSVGQVVRYNIQTQVNQGAFTSGYAFSTPIGLAFGPNGALFTNDLDNSEIARFKGSTGAFQSVVVPSSQGGSIIVADDQTIYESATYALGQFINGQFVITDPSRGHILGYDPQTGSMKSDYEGAVGGEFGDLRFGPDHNLYVTDDLKNQVVRFDGQTGTPLGAFTSGGALQNPFGLDFGPDGNLYVTSRDNHEILRYNGKTGAYLDVFASGAGLSFPDYAAFGPDHNLYVADFGANEISRFNGTTGAHTVFASGAGPLAFAPTPEPGMLALLVGLGGAGGGLLLRRRK